MRKQTMTQEPRWFSADGDSWEDADAWESASADAWESAEGDRRAAKVSKPFLLRIVNACTSAIADVDLGDSYNNRQATNQNQNTNITLSNRVSGFTINEFLAQTETQPFKVGKMLVICTTAAQFNETMTLTHRDSNGNRLDQVITFTLDPYQQQTDRYLIEEEFVFDGYTRLRFSNIRGSATVDINLYPAGKFAAAQVVAGRPAAQEYASPRIVRAVATPIAVPRPRMIGRGR